MFNIFGHGEMQVKTTLGFHLYPVRKAKQMLGKNQGNESLYTVGENAN